MIKGNIKAKGDMEDLTRSLSGSKWRRIGGSRRAGVLVPLFSVYSGRSIGVGEFGDLRLLVDWCKASGLSVLQLLPMNEVGSTFCPYDAMSSFALESAYISIENLPGAGCDSMKSGLAALRKRFPAGRAYVDYGVRDAKLQMLRKIYTAPAGRADSREFTKFTEENSYWLEDFALFKSLKAFHRGLPWYEWLDEYRNRDAARIAAFRKSHAADIVFEKWIQWIAFTQFSGAKEYAGSNGVLLCGDLPILISRDSADVWSHPDLFKLDFAAGAPPDMYCAKGQRWGVPTYDWEKIAEDDYRYPLAKLKFAENFYDILRIDHVVGLFRIWSIPYSEPSENAGLNGFFDPKDEKEWGPHGRKILSVMSEGTSMMLFAEDLGMIPKACPETLKEYGIPGNDVQRWTKDWSTRHDFLPPEEYRLAAIAMLSTHDTTNWSAWWQYEAGTVDEALFIRKATDRGIDYGRVKAELFDQKLSYNGRLRWRDTVSSAEKFIEILGKREEELRDFLDMYENSFHEKEKLWNHMGLKGKIREKADAGTVKAALEITFSSRSVFCIELIIDYLCAGGLFKGDPYRYRINRPGTVRPENWSIVIPIALEDLPAHPVSTVIRSMAKAAGRAK